VVLGALGKREDDCGGTSPLADDERAMVRRQTLKVVIQSALVAVAATALVWLLPM
jgi:hypothetical protein